MAEEIGCVDTNTNIKRVQPTCLIYRDGKCNTERFCLARLMEDESICSHLVGCWQETSRRHVAPYTTLVSCFDADEQVREHIK